MKTRNLSTFRDAAILAAVFAAFLAGAVYCAYLIHHAIEVGLLERRGRDVAMAENPVAFWLGIAWRAAAGFGLAFFAMRVVIMAFRMHKKGVLFANDDRLAARKHASRKTVAPLIDETKTTTIDRI